MKKPMLIPVLGLAVTGVALGGGQAGPVRATEVEFHITLSAPSGKAGKVSFTVKNAGHLAHQFLVLKTKLAAGALPVKGTTVDIAKAGKLIGGITGAGLKAGASKTISLNLPAGHYVLFCNLPAHYKSGQYATFTVK